jgi:hypothetical protein
VTDAPDRGVIALLTAQAVAFGVTLALLVVPANALFLNEYGSKWLPATYIAIAVVGTGASALIARAARRTRLVQVATVSLSALAVLYAASWLLLVLGAIWVSAFLLVLFSIALQMGFVFIGGQAGRLLDVRQMKERFPRVIGGFSAGFLVGGLLGIPLLALLGSTEQLLLATTVAQLVFLALLLATERRFPEVRAVVAAGAPKVPRPSAKVLFASRLVLLLFAYQFLSAMGSWLLDFLLFNRAQAQYSGDDLTRFLAGYTAVLNLVAILFLAAVAGPLMRRFGLRLGLVLNPAVVVIFLAIMAAVVAGPGLASYAVFVIAAVVRLSDIVLTDGTTRTSVNASFQVVPVEERLAVQAFVEGIGNPIAIGATGVVLLAINVVGLGPGTVIVFGIVVGVIWTLTGAAMYRAYTGALGDEMRSRSLVADGIEIAEGDVALETLLRSDDIRDVRLALDLIPGGASATAAVLLGEATAHNDPEVRVQALVRLAAAGDATAAATAAALVGTLAASPDPAERRAAAAALGATRPAAGDERSTLVRLLGDDDGTVRAAALDAVAPDDVVDDELVRLVVAAAEEARTQRNAAAALRRLGPSVIPLVAAALARNGGARRTPLVRAAAAAAAEHGVSVIEPALRDPDRVVVLAALSALDAAGGREAVPPTLLDDVFDDAVIHAARAVAARDALSSDGRPASDELRRALADELDLARQLVVAVLATRHGDGVRAAVQVIERADGQRRALGVEALDVMLSRDESEVALPLIRRDLTQDQAPLRARAQVPERAPAEWIADLADDPGRVWRSPWLARCARELVAGAAG